MGTGRIRLDGNRLVPLAGIGCLEAEAALAADREQRDIASAVVRRYARRTRSLPGLSAACVQDIEKFTRIGHQGLDGIVAARGIRRVLGRGQIAQVVVDSEAANLIVLRAGDVKITDGVIRAAGSDS